jgi:FkbM family methyltransferase
MTHSVFGRYRNLIRFVANWRAHFKQKGNKGYLPMEITTRGNGITFSVPTKSLYMVFKEIFMSDFYRIKELVKLLPSNPMIVDIGGNAGYFNMMLFSQIDSAKVIAYEPIAENCTLFKANVMRNSVMTDKVQVFNLAVTGTHIEEISIYKEVENDNSVTASVFNDFSNQNQNIIKIKAITLEQIVESNDLKTVDLLKLDCEGSEYPILYETPKHVWDKVKIIYMEDHPLDTDKRNHASAISYLETLGFRCDSILADNECYAVLATKQYLAKDS